MSGHPIRCQGCRGTGLADGPPIIETVQGRPHRYTTVTPCTHDWWHDDTGYDPHYDDTLAAGHPRAIEAFNRGYVQGMAELDAMRTPPASTPPASRRQDTDVA